MSYQVSPAQAVEASGKLMKEGACESVKLEGGQEVAEQVHRIVRTGIPVVGHVGLTPQSVHALGGFKVQGRGDEAAEKIMADAIALEQAGAFAIVLEAVPPDLAERITSAVSVPTIGIGAGVGCDGQVLVCTDLLGLSRGHQPKFAKRFANLGDEAARAIGAYVAQVRSGEFPAAAQTYKPNSATSPREEARIFRRELTLDHGDLDTPLPLDHWH
jgi:3-methyl-2-oxobutanoate hydroxymethyltransferase